MMAFRPRSSGFSLIELLVVLIIIGVAAGAVRLAITEDDPMRDLHRSAEQLAYTLGQAQDRVLLSNRERGVHVLTGGLRFLEWREGDPMMAEPDVVWSESAARPIEWQADEDTELLLELDGDWIELFEEMPQEPLEWRPHVILLPSEEYIPAYKLVLRSRDFQRGEIQVVGDGFNRPEVVRVEN